MKLAVTGGSGDIARAFMRQYADEFSFLSLSRAAGGGSVGTSYDPAELAELFSGCDAVVHLASQKAARENEAGGLVRYFDSLRVTENVLKAARTRGIRNVVFTSSRCVYGDYTDTAFSENDPTHPINYYGVHKVACEQLCGYYSRHFGLNVKALRLGQVIGADPNDASLFGTFLRNARDGGELTLLGRDIRDYVYIKDVSLAIAQAVRHPQRRGIYNISMGIGLDNRAIARSLLDRFPDATVRTPDVPAGYRPTRIVLDVRKAAGELDFTCAYSTIGDIVRDAAGSAL